MWVDAGLVSDPATKRKRLHSPDPNQDKGPNAGDNGISPLKSRNMRSLYFELDTLEPEKIANRCFGMPSETDHLRKYQRAEKCLSPQTMPPGYLMPRSHSAPMLELIMG